MKNLFLTAALAAALFADTRSAETCCMTPVTYKGSISQKAQEAILFHHDRREELILRINYQIEGDGLPETFAWIVTVPSEPDLRLDGGRLLRDAGEMTSRAPWPSSPRPR